MDIIEILWNEPWAYRAVVSAVLVGIMCGLLGCFVVLRQMALIGDALSHAVLPGVVLAFLVLGYHNTWGFFVGSVLAGLVTAVAITWIQNNVPTKNDAAVGIVFTTMFAIGVIGISWISQNEGVHLDLKDFLFGNVLGVSDQDLTITAATCCMVVLGVIVFYRYLFITTFQPIIAETLGISVQLVHYLLMLLLSFAVVASLQTVGVILVVSLLIAPAATALLISQRLPIVLTLAALLGSVSGVLGIIASIYFETTPGPAITLVLTFFYIMAICFSPQHGFFQKFQRQRKQYLKTLREDILKEAQKLHDRGKLTKEQLGVVIPCGKIMLLKQLKYLKHKNYFEASGDTLRLSEKGAREAKRLVRAHRLWETYLANKLGLSVEQIHADAEKYEHLLTEDILDEVDESLGYPALDPHGSVIPSKHGQPFYALSRLQEGVTGVIARNQMTDSVYTRLWQLNLMPEMSFEVVTVRDNVCVIKVDDRSLEIPLQLARTIQIQPDGIDE